MITITEIKNLNIDLSVKRVTPEEMQKKLDARQNSILSAEKLAQKIAIGEAIAIGPEESENQVYVYISKKQDAEMSKVHFYGVDGSLMFTYPWNGRVAGTDEAVAEASDEGIQLSSYSSKIFGIEVIATESGRVAIRSKEGIVAASQSDPRNGNKGYFFQVKSRNGEKILSGVQMLASRIGPKIDIEQYQNVSDDHYECEGVTASFLTAVAVEGDRAIDKAFENAREA